MFRYFVPGHIDSSKPCPSFCGPNRYSLLSLRLYRVICCRNTTSSFCCNKSGTTLDCGIQIRRLSAFWTVSTTRVTYGCRTRTFTCTATLSPPSGLYGSLCTCTETAGLSTQPGRVVEIPVPILTNIGLDYVENHKKYLLKYWNNWKSRKCI